MTTKPPKAPRLRHEIKHQILPGEDLVLTGRLRRLFPHDSHAGPDGSYQITSLYFDTPYDDALRQKLDGADPREKFRLRYYGAELTTLRLEKKYKRGGLCGKRSAPVPIPLARQLLAGDYLPLLASGDPLLMEFYSKLQGRRLQPQVLVRYDREAFLYGPGNVRVTLDRRLRTGLGNTDLLHPEAPYVEAADGYTVLEVKYDDFLPSLVRMAVQVPGKQASACSKYALCRRYD